MKKTNYLFFALIILHNLLNVNCVEEDDLDILVSLNDGKSRIEAFKSEKNDLFLKNIKLNNDTYSIRKLKWYSFGYPLVIKDKKSNKNNSERFYYIQKDGFYIIVQLLTEYQKKLIIKSVFEKYNITVELHQIEQIPLSSFECDLYLNHDGSDTVVKGSAKKALLSKYPLRVDFQANEQELGFLEHFSSENDLEFECIYKSSRSKMEKEFIVETDQSNLVKKNLSITFKNL
jgi:hypothetical protein